jgi:hypothetical protein
MVERRFFFFVNPSFALSLPDCFPSFWSHPALRIGPMDDYPALDRENRVVRFYKRIERVLKGGGPYAIAT